MEEGNTPAGIVKVVPIRDGKPLLTDIPGMLRNLANELEAGKIEMPRRAMCVLVGPVDRMTIYHWGGDATVHEVAGAFMDAAQLTLKRD